MGLNRGGLQIIRKTMICFAHCLKYVTGLKCLPTWKASVCLHAPEADNDSGAFSCYLSGNITNKKCVFFLPESADGDLFVDLGEGMFS